jgi:pilus assembly protein Flp/PilA
MLSILSAWTKVKEAWTKNRTEEGVTAIEYGLIAALIAVAIIGAVALVGTNLTNVFNSVANNLP